MAALCNSFASAEVEKAFTDNEIIPDTLNVAPKKLLNVSLTDNNFDIKLMIII